MKIGQQVLAECGRGVVIHYLCPLLLPDQPDPPEPQILVDRPSLVFDTLMTVVISTTNNP